jgi:hypothetical protein
MINLILILIIKSDDVTTGVVTGIGIEVNTFEDGTAVEAVETAVVGIESAGNGVFQFSRVLLLESDLVSEMIITEE